MERVTRAEYLRMWGIPEGTPEADDAWSKKVAFMDEREAVQTAYVVGDMKPFISVVDGSIITGRAAHREHIIKHDLIEVGNERMPKRVEQRQSFGREIKHHLDQVRAMPDRAYADMVQRKRELNRGP